MLTKIINFLFPPPHQGPIISAAAIVRQIQKGDVVVVHTETNLKPEQARTISDIFKEVFEGKGVKIIVLEKGMKIEVFSNVSGFTVEGKLSAQTIEEFQKEWTGGGGAGGPVHEGGGGGIGKIIEKDAFLDRVNLYLKTQVADDEWWFEVEADHPVDPFAETWTMTAQKSLPDGNTAISQHSFMADDIRKDYLSIREDVLADIVEKLKDRIKNTEETPRTPHGIAPQEAQPVAMEEMVKAKASTAQQQVQMNKDTQMEKAFKVRWPDVEYAKHLVAGTMLPGGGEKYLYNGEAFLELAPVQFTSIELSDRHQIVVTQAFKYIGDGE